LHTLKHWFGEDIVNRTAMAAPVALVSLLMLAPLFIGPVSGFISWIIVMVLGLVPAAVSWLLLVAPLIVVVTLWYNAAQELSLMALIKGSWHWRLVAQGVVMTLGLASALVLAYMAWQWFVLLLAGTYIVDSLAFATGRAYTRVFHGATHKLPFGLDRLSPNKTIEGFVGGAVAGWIVTFLLMWAFVAFAGMVVTWYGVATVILLPFVAFIGDLFESQLKRVVGVKDTGDCLGAHGGLLDRLDSVCAVFATPLLPLLLILVALPSPSR